MNMHALLKNYYQHFEAADRFCFRMQAELQQLMDTNSIQTASPIDGRVKEWSSIVLNVDRGLWKWEDVRESDDFVGLRIALAFLSDIDRVEKAIDDTFNVVERKKKGDAYGLSEFGYQSLHLIVRLKEPWHVVPTFYGCEEFCAEIQIRTLSQHTWAVASRRLDYKQESAAPRELRRSLIRLAAILESVDEELERISSAKWEYAKRMAAADPISQPDSELNVDLLPVVLERLLPGEHKLVGDLYGELFFDLKRCGIMTIGQVIELVKEFLVPAMAENASAINAARSGDLSYSGDPQQIEKGIFYSWVGLAENMLNKKFGTDWRRNPPRNSIGGI
jgi:ppGpp synthetase/RelA/SpoT-type nucleotidyltranferase